MRNEFLTRRPRLAAELRRLRTAAGFSTTELARKLGWSQSKVSKMELGRTTAAVADVEAWARATGAADRIADLHGLAEQALFEASAFRGELQERLPRQQHEVAALERVTCTLRSFSPTLIPGLLQVPEYSRAVFESGHPGSGAIAGAVAARVERQAVLYEAGHEFEFIVGEGAFRWRFGPEGARDAQIDRIRLVAGLSNVRFGVLPLDVEGPVWSHHAFTLYDDRSDEGEPVVMVETLTVRVTVSDPEQVDRYRQMLDRLRAAAAFDLAALDLLES